MTTADCRDCARYRGSLKRLDTLTRQRAHEALAGHIEPFARATHAIETARDRYDAHLAKDHQEVPG